MNELHEKNDELDIWITNWEQQCIEEVETSPDLETQIQSEKDTSAQKLWLLFQNSATCIAQLYKDRQQGVSLWVPFQNAAASVTNLYKECIDAEKRLTEMGFQCGYQRRNKDLMAWVKKRKRHIRREDLIAFLSGKNPPTPRSWSSPRPRLSLDGMRTPPHHSITRIAIPSAEPEAYPVHCSNESDLQTFREALALSTLSSAVSTANVNCRQHVPGSPPSSYSRNHRGRSGAQGSSLNDLNSFIAEEFARHVESRKRAPSTDVIMDSPTHKRSRLT